MNVTDLIRIHKARIAHHVAAVRQIDREHGSAAEFDIARAVMMDVLVLCSLKIAAVKERFDALEKLRIGRHHIDKLAVRRAGLFHHDLAVFLDDLRLDLAGMRIHQDLKRNRLIDHALANLLDAGRAQRIGLTRKTERRSCALVRF